MSVISNCTRVLAMQRAASCEILLLTNKLRRCLIDDIKDCTVLPNIHGLMSSSSYVPSDKDEHKQASYTLMVFCMMHGTLVHFHWVHMAYLSFNLTARMTSLPSAFFVRRHKQSANYGIPILSAHVHPILKCFNISPTIFTD